MGWLLSDPFICKYWCTGISIVDRKLQWEFWILQYRFACSYCGCFCSFYKHNQPLLFLSNILQYRFACSYCGCFCSFYKYNQPLLFLSNILQYRFACSYCGCFCSFYKYNQPLVFLSSIYKRSIKYTSFLQKWTWKSKSSVSIILLSNPTVTWQQGDSDSELIIWLWIRLPNQNDFPYLDSKIYNRWNRTRFRPNFSTIDHMSGY